MSDIWYNKQDKGKCAPLANTESKQEKQEENIMSLTVTNINEMKAELAAYEKKIAELKADIEEAKKNEFLSSLMIG